MPIPIIISLVVWALAGSQIKDVWNSVTGENSTLGGLSLPLLALGAVGAYTLWKKVK